MKKLLLSLILIPAFGISQNIYNYGFNTPTASLATDGWSRTNQSTPATTTLWSVANFAASTTVSATTPAPPFQSQSYTTGQVAPAPLGQDGTANNFALVNFTSTGVISGTGAASGTGTISNWLISPSINVIDGDVISFWTRKGVPSNAAAASDFPDRLEMRMAPTASATTPTSGSGDIGGFTTLAKSVNPTLVGGFIYPKVWTQFSYTVTGYPTSTAVKFAFRYFVTNGGNDGANSDIIGIDTFSVDRTPLKSNEFFKNNFSVAPNPMIDVVNISKNSNIEITSASITDINGRIVKEVNNDISSINVADLNAGVYFLKVTTTEGSGTTKLIKN